MTAEETVVVSDELRDLQDTCITDLLEVRAHINVNVVGEGSPTGTMRKFWAAIVSFLPFTSLCTGPRPHKVESDFQGELVAKISEKLEHVRESVEKQEQLLVECRALVDKQGCNIDAEKYTLKTMRTSIDQSETKVATAERLQNIDEKAFRQLVEFQAQLGELQRLHTLRCEHAEIYKNKLHSICQWMQTVVQDMSTCTDGTEGSVLLSESTPEVFKRILQDLQIPIEGSVATDANLRRVLTETTRQLAGRRAEEEDIQDSVDHILCAGFVPEDFCCACGRRFNDEELEAEFSKRLLERFEEVTVHPHLRDHGINVNAEKDRKSTKKKLEDAEKALKVAERDAHRPKDDEAAQDAVENWQTEVEKLTKEYETLKEDVEKYIAESRKFDIARKVLKKVFKMCTDAYEKFRAEEIITGVHVSWATYERSVIQPMRRFTATAEAIQKALTRSSSSTGQKALGLPSGPSTGSAGQKALLVA